VKTLNQHIGQNGSAAVEFAIVLPLLVTLVFGIIEFSILFYNKAMITNASREGARAGIVFNSELSDADRAQLITDTVNNYCSTYLITFGAGSTSPTVTVPPIPETGQPLTITVDYHYDFLVLPNLISTLIGGLDLSAVTVMRME
jgi:Flp pilus assembly protein TadG